MSDEKKEHPLIFPEGNAMMKPEEFFALRYKQANIPEDDEETIFLHMTPTCLNETPIVVNSDQFNALDPELVVCDLLEELLAELRQRNPYEINSYEALTMSYEAKIQNIFKRTYILRYLNLNRLKRNEHTTCFLVNLANLMWIHALFSFGEDFHNGLHYKNWCLRQIHFNMIGYRVGNIEFISLFDLHSRLLDYPAIFRTNVLNSFNVIEDPRLHCALSQPYVFSPKLTVLVPNTYDEDLDDLQNQYIRNYIVVDSNIDLLIPMPLMMQLERSSCKENTENVCIENTDGIPEKLALLINVLDERGFPYYDLLSKDVHVMNDTAFTIKLEYHILDMDLLPKIRKSVWKCCRFHKSFYHCLQHHATLVRSTFQDDHLSVNSMCRCKDKTAVCVNNVLQKMSEMYNPLLNEYRVDIDLNNNGLRCLYSAISFAVGIKRKKDRLILGADTGREFAQMIQIIESFYMSSPTSHICGKIRVCVKIFLIANEVRERWPKWYNIFIDDPSSVLSFVVDRKNFTLADEWILAVHTLQTGYTFALPVFAKYLSSLSGIENPEWLRKALGLLGDLSIGDICDYVTKNYFEPHRLINLITAVIDSDILNKTDKIKFYALLTGLKMIIIIPACDQSFYYDIAGYPLLIIEQLILNKRINLLKTVLEKGVEFISSLPECVRRTESLSRDEIDEMLRDYATKALHFRKKPAAVDCINAALLHAEIFKEGNFHPPDEVPSSKKWIPNNWMSKCMCCKNVEFSVFVRRHHCRRCGRVVCDSCSLKRMKVATYRGVVRVCDQCYDFEAQYENMDDSVSDNSTATDDSGKKPIYKLSPDSDTNTLIRQQAGFDSAPDIELCLSILELHSECIAVPRTLYANAESLIKILRQRIVCPANFDYNEITHITRSLLLAAKIYYTHLGEPHGIRRCEELTSELDIVTQLASLKLFPSESAKPLRDIKELRKIRDTVLERQQWELALEISTKIGLECNSIWYLWGKTLLKAGDYAGARDKISRSNVRRNAAMLNDIIDIIYAIAEKEATRSFVSLFRLNSTKSTVALPDNLMEECLHYIGNYGTPQQQFEFYAKHDRLEEVMKVVFESNIPPKQFVDKVFAPYMKNNDYATVLRWMKTLDASLVEWQDYINEIGVFCKRNQLFNELYDIQLWSEDYYRATISCTLFYTKDAITYGQLVKREEYLVKAISHMSAFMETREGSEPSPASVRQLTSLKMQMEVTKMIASNSTCANMKFARVPTLLGTESSKCTIICLLFDSQKDFKIAFNFTERMIAEFSLNVSKVYKKLTEHFLLRNQEQNVITLISCIQETKLDRTQVIDDVASFALTYKVDVDVFLKYISDVPKKIEMLITCNRLKSAYTEAVCTKKLEYNQRLEFIERITNECEKANMGGLLSICRKKLAELESKKK